MRASVAEVVEQLERYPSPWREVLDEVRLDEPAGPDASAEVVVEPVRWLLERVGNGLTLTGAGYLPPAVVTSMWHELGYAERYPWTGRGNREEHARPVQDVREAATRLGLLRLAKRRLSVTKAGATLSTIRSGCGGMSRRGCRRCAARSNGRRVSSSYCSRRRAGRTTRRSSPRVCRCSAGPARTVNRSVRATSSS